MAGYRDDNRQNDNQGKQEQRRPWENYRSTRQSPDYGSAGGQYTTRVGPDQDPYGNDAGAYAGAGSQGRWQGWDDERSGRGRGGYGQVGGARETAEDQGGYGRGDRQDGNRTYRQAGYGEERDWGRDHGGCSQTGYGQGNPPDAGQLAYGPNAQSYGQQVAPGYGGRSRGYGTNGAAAGQTRPSAEDHHDPDYREWRRDQARKYDDDYGSWRESQLKAHDDEYARWRGERKDKFGQSFSEWRGKRPGPSGSGEMDEKKGR